MVLRGKQGKIAVKIGDAQTAVFLVKMTSWEFSSSTDVDDTAYFGGSLTEEGYKEKTPTTIDWSMKGSGALDSTDANRKALFDAHKNGDLVEMTLYLNSTSGIRGSGILDSYELSDDADGKVELSINLAGNGEADMFETTTP